MNQSANAVLARVRAMYGKRVTNTDYSALLSCNSATEIVNYLKTRTAYGDIFAPTGAETVTPESVEFSLNKELANRLQKICAYEKMINDGFYDYFVLKSDIELIIDAARTLVSSSSLATSYVPSDFFKERSALHIEKLYNAKSASELIEALKHTRYYPTAKKFIGSDGMFDFSSVEILLMRFYAASAKAMGKKLNRTSQKELCAIIDFEVDALNIENIYRLKRLGAKNDTVLAKLIFEHGSIGKNKLTRLMECTSESDFFALLSKTGIGKDISNADTLYPEKNFNINKFKLFKRYLRFSSSPDIVLICYINLLQLEISNITHIIEGKRYKMANDQIIQFLVGVE